MVQPSSSSPLPFEALRPQPPATEPRRPRIPKTLAARIDRLARHAHAFHRFAHHPLCTYYAPELVAIGRRTKVCRGCLYVTLGVLGGTVAGVLSSPRLTFATSAAVLAIGLAALGLAARLPKPLTRFAPVALLAWGASAGVWLAALALGVVGVVVMLYRRRGPNRAPCVTCVERHAAVCSGLAPIVRRERAFQRLAARWQSPRPPGTARPPAPR